MKFWDEAFGCLLGCKLWWDLDDWSHHDFPAVYPSSNNPSLDVWITNLAWRSSFFCCLAFRGSLPPCNESLEEERLGQALRMNWMKNAYMPGPCSWKDHKWVGNGSSVRSNLVQQNDRIIRHCHFCHLQMTKNPVDDGPLWFWYRVKKNSTCGCEV